MNSKLVWALKVEVIPQFCNLVRADKWLKMTRLNSFGDDPGTAYLGGTPLFNEGTNEVTYRYDYLLKKFLPWCDNSDCSLAKALLWLEEMNLNEYGDPDDTVYAGSNPLFDMESEELRDHYDYLVENFLPWMTDEFTCDDRTIYPNCMTDWPSRIGDNVCDDVWNTEECGYDEGDCTASI